VRIDGAGSAVRAFTVDSGEREVEVRIDPAVDYGFDLVHLREHQQTGDPVLCTVESRDGSLYALVIADG
jgi:hypothetical protein